MLKKMTGIFTNEIENIDVDENRIIVIASVYDEANSDFLLTKEWKIPVSFTMTTADKFDAKIDKILSDKNLELNEMIIFCNGFKYGTFEDLADDM